MSERFQDILISTFRQLPTQVVIVRNVDGFLSQAEMNGWFELNLIKVFSGSNLEFRIFFELEIRTGKCPFDKILYLNNNPKSVLEDISQVSSFWEFQLDELLPEFHLETIRTCHLDLLNFLYDNKPFRTQDKQSTMKFILEQYYGVDMDNFNNREIVLCKWLEWFQKDMPAEHHILEFFIEKSEAWLNCEIIKDRKSFLGYLNYEWKHFVDSGNSNINFSFQPLKNLLSIYFLNKWLEPVARVSKEPFHAGIPFGIKSLEKDQAVLELTTSLRDLTNGDIQDWLETARSVAYIILESLELRNYDVIAPFLEQINFQFQQWLSENYKPHILPSNPYKSPKVVSKVLDHLKMQYSDEDQVALFVIDGMAYWQYLLIRKDLESFQVNVEEHTTFSWIPSITQLSRQAIFKGGTPDTDYVQNPGNEEKLWREYWEKSGVSSSRVKYCYGVLDKTGVSNFTRLAIVNKDLDEKMHSSSDLNDLFSLTKNWIERSDIINQINFLASAGYHVFITADHGNIQAKGWRHLKNAEKFGTGKSRSRRHLEYLDERLADEFLVTNPELASVIGKDENILYLQDSSSFSNKESEVTHGGSHFLEVLIPFVKIN